MTIECFNFFLWKLSQKCSVNVGVLPIHLTLMRQCNGTTVDVLMLLLLSDINLDHQKSVATISFSNSFSGSLLGLSIFMIERVMRNSKESSEGSVVKPFLA